MLRGDRVRVGIALGAVVLAAALVVALLLVARGAGGTPSSEPTERIPTLPAAGTAWPDVAILGDSYTEGAGSSTATRERRWTTVLAKQMQWDEHNLAVPGTGYVAGAQVQGSYENLVDAIANVSPDIVLVSGGRNDAWSTPEEIRAAALRLFDGIAEAVPGARIIVLSPWWDDDEPPATLTAVTAAVRDAAEEAGLEYVDTGQPLLGHPDLIDADGIHPNDAGHAALAAAVAAALSGR